MRLIDFERTVTEHVTRRETIVQQAQECVEDGRWASQRGKHRRYHRYYSNWRKRIEEATQ